MRNYTYRYRPSISIGGHKFYLGTQPRGPTKPKLKDTPRTSLGSVEQDVIQSRMWNSVTRYLNRLADDSRAARTLRAAVGVRRRPRHPALRLSRRSATTCHRTGQS